MKTTVNVQKIMKNAVQNDCIFIDNHNAILLHTAVKELNEILEFQLSLIAEDVLSFLNKIPKRHPADSNFQKWWIDALEYVTNYDLLHNNPELYDELGGKEFFKNRYQKWFTEHPLYLETGIYFFNDEGEPTLDLIGSDTFFDLYTLFHNGTFDENIWRENFLSHELTTEEIDSLRQIKIKNLIEPIDSTTLC